MIINKRNILKLGTIILAISVFLLFKYKKENIIQETEASSDVKIVEEINEKEKELGEIKALVKKYENGIAKLVNKDNGLDENYVPDDLVRTNVTCTKSGIYVSESILTPLEKMFYDAQKENINLYLVSGYRSSSYQSQLYANALKKYSQSYTEKYVAKPTHSEHQTGLAVDISSKCITYKLVQSFENTDEGKWLAENAHKYGFILRYKKDRVDDTGYGYEPWHFRYVGKTLATYIYENDLILEDLY